MLIECIALRLRHIKGAARVEILHEAGESLVTLPKDLRVAGLDLGLFVGVDGGVAQRTAVVGGALEDSQMLGFLGDVWDELHSRGAGADHADALAGEIDLLVRPARGVKGLPLEALDARNVRHMGGGQNADRRDHILSARAMTVFGGDVPAVGLLIIDGRLDARIEADVRPELELVGHEVQIFLVLGLARKVLGPVPFLQQFFGERIGVAIGFGIEARTRIAIPVPGAADAAAGFETAGVEAELAQAIELVEPRYPSADDQCIQFLDSIGVRCGHILCCSGHVFLLHGRCHHTKNNGTDGGRRSALMSPLLSTS